MFKIEIRTEDGKEIQFSRGNYVNFRNPDEKEQFWEWTHFANRDAEFDRICETAAKMAEDIEALLPDMPMSPLR